MVFTGFINCGTEKMDRSHWTTSNQWVWLWKWAESPSTKLISFLKQCCKSQHCQCFEFQTKSQFEGKTCWNGDLQVRFEVLLKRLFVSYNLKLIYIKDIWNWMMNWSFYTYTCSQNVKKTTTFDIRVPGIDCF